MAFVRTGFVAVAVAGAVAVFGIGCSASSEAPDSLGESTSELRRNDPCATVRCAAGTHCESKGRRASCVADAPSACATVLCAPNTTCVETPSGPSCECTTVGLCVQGYAWDSATCNCVATSPSECTTDADCRLVDDYCGGCNCIALSTNETGPTCDNPVMCFAQPCAVTTGTAACVSGSCTLVGGL